MGSVKVSEIRVDRHTPSEMAVALISRAVATGVESCQIELGLRNRTVSRRRAIELVGRRTLEAWEARGLIQARKRSEAANGKQEYDLLRLRELQLADGYEYLF